MNPEIYRRLSILANAMQTKVLNNSVKEIKGFIPIGAIKTSTLESYLDELYEILSDIECEGIKQHIEKSTTEDFDIKFEIASIGGKPSYKWRKGEDNTEYNCLEKKAKYLAEFIINNFEYPRFEKPETGDNDR